MNKRLRKILAAAVPAVAAVSFCTPLACMPAMAGAATPTVPVLAEDGGHGDVILCVEKDQANAIESAATGCDWAVLMDVDAAPLANALDGVSMKTADQGGYQLVEVTSSTTSGKAIVKWAKGIDGVASAQKNSEVKCAEATQSAALDGESDDSEYVTPTSYYDSTQALGSYSHFAWFLNNTGQIADGKVGFDIDIPAGVASTSDQVVAIIDGGIAYDNPALMPYMIDLTTYSGGQALMDSTGANKYGICTVDGKEPADNYDGNGHGSHCAGIVAQVATQGGTQGSVRLMDVRAGDESGSFTDASLIKACKFVIQAREAGVNVVSANMSLGGAGFLTDGQRIAVSQMAQSGVACAVASGNTEADGDSIPDSCGSYNIDGLLLVGASGPDGTMSTYTTYGARSVNVIAPGTCIYSTYNRQGAQFVSQLAVQNTLNDVENASQALYNEGFETAGTVGASEDPNIGDSLSWSYALCSFKENAKTGKTTAKITDSDRALQYSTKHSFQGSRSLLLGAWEDNTLVSEPIDSSLLANAEALNFNVWTNKDQCFVDYYFVDEDGTVYTTEGYSRNCIKRAWVNLNSQSEQLLLKDVRAAAQQGHKLRLVIKPNGSQKNKKFFIDDVCFGYGVEGYAMIQGTSMATPMVAGVYALLAAQYPEASATELTARVCGGATYDSSLDNKCTTAGFLNVAGAMDPKPAIQSTSISKNVLTIYGYFFGDEQGTVKVGNTVATVDTWVKIQGDFYSVSIDLPGTVTKGNNTVWITSASGRTGRTVVNLTGFKAANTFKNFPEMPQEINDSFNTVAMCATSKTLYLFGTYLNGSNEEESESLQGKARVVACPLSTKAYKNKGLFDLAKLAGFSGRPKIEEPSGLVVGGVPYLCCTLKNKFCVFKYDAAKNKFSLVCKTSSAVTDVCSKGSNLFLIYETTVEKGKCDIKAMRKWKNGKYAAMYKLNLNTGKRVFKGAMRLGSVQSYYEYSYYVTGKYVTALTHHRSKVLTGVCKLSAFSAKHAVSAKKYVLSNMKADSYYATNLGKRLAVINMFKKNSADKSCLTWFFDPSTGKWTKDKTLISPYNIDFCSVTSHGNTLYVRAMESATINPHINFISYYTF